MNNYNENNIQLFEKYKDSCNNDAIEYLRTEGKHQFIDFVNARNNELNSYPNLSEHKDILTSYNNSYSRLFSDIVMIYHYADKYSIDNSYEDNGAYLNAFNLRQINIKKLLKNIRDKSFVINHYLLQNKRATAIYYQEYCLRAFDLFIDCLNDFEIKIQLSPLNELFERTKQVLVDSINIERIKITQEIEKSKSKEIVNEKKNPFPKIFNCEDDKAYNLFKDFANEIVTDYYLDYSFIFHKMQKPPEQLIDKDCKHKYFMEWLLKEKYISESVYDIFKDKESFSRKADKGNRPTRYYVIKNRYFPLDSD